MSRRNIIILVICTIILVAASITTIRKEPAISGAFLSLNKDAVRDEIKTEDDHYYFKDPGADIYLILSVKNLNTSDRVMIKWKAVENGTQEIIQENTVYPDQNGSGEIVLSLVKRNESYSPGIYMVDIFLNNSLQFSREFTLSEG